MSIIDEYKKRVKGMVRNHSSKILWVIETDTGKPKAHKLGPKRKSPKGMDAAGFKRFDGKSISNHPIGGKYIIFQQQMFLIGAKASR